MTSTLTSDADDQEDELEALAAMFPGDALTIVAENEETTQIRLRVVDVAPFLTVELVAWVGAHIAYPSEVAPPFLVEIVATQRGGVLDDARVASLRDECSSELQALFEPGQVVLWTWAAALRERCAECEEAAQLVAASADSLAAAQPAPSKVVGATPPRVRTAASASAAAARPPPAAFAQQLALADAELGITHGPKFEVKRSVFQAHCAGVTTAAEVANVVTQLLRNPKVARASHNMMAYRIGVEPNVLSDNDEDGEHGAGASMSFLLAAMDATDVVVVVSRWYGGTHLGPQRFKIIKNMAREIVQAGGYAARA